MIKVQKIFAGSTAFGRVIKNSSYLFSATGLSAGLGLVQGIMTARLLGVYDYGVLGAIMLFTNVVNNLVSFKMSEVVIKYVGHYSETGDHARAAALFKLAALVEVGASLVAFGLLWLLAPLGATFLAKDSGLSGLFVLYGLVVLANLISETSTGLLQIFDRFKRMAALFVLSSAITLAGVAVAYWIGGGLAEVLTAYLLGKSVSSLILSIVAIVEARRHWGAMWRQAPLALLRPQLDELARFALNTNVAATLSLVTKDSELLLVSGLRNPAEAGLYRLALTLTNIVQMPLNPLPQTTYPELSRLAARGDWSGMRSLLKRGALLAGVYAAFATLFLLLFGRPLIAWLYTPQFLPSYPALMIVLVGLMAANTFFWRRPALLALGQAGYPTRVNLVLATLKLAGVLWLTPRYGFLAAAALLAAFYLTTTFLTVWKVYATLPKAQAAA